MCATMTHCHFAGKAVTMVGTVNGSRLAAPTEGCISAPDICTLARDWFFEAVDYDCDKAHV